MLKLTPLIFLVFLPVDLGLGQSVQITDKVQAHEPLEIIVSVTNRRRNPIQGLKQENFQIFIDKIQQKIEGLSEVDEPFSIGIVIDASGSVQNSAKMPDLAQVVSRFKALSNEHNEYFLVAFNSTPELLMDWGTNLDPGLAKLITIKPQRYSAFYDACYVAAEKVNRGHHRKRALIVFSDGQDNISRYTWKELRELLRETDTQIYAIALETEADSGSALSMEAQAQLDELADLSGGLSFFRPNGGRWRPEELGQVVETLAGSLRHQYRIRFTPTYKPTEKWHRLKIKMNMTDPPPAELKGLSARAREGFYLVPAQAK